MLWWSTSAAQALAVPLDGTGVNQSFITGAIYPNGVAVSVPVAQVSSPAVFGSTPEGTLSASETVTVTNGGQPHHKPVVIGYTRLTVR